MFAADNAKVVKLKTISPTLKKELEEWRDFRTCTINRLRTGARVNLITHEGELASLLRFFGYCNTTENISSPSMKLLREDSICKTVEKYLKSMEDKLKYSSITNYLTAIISAAQFANAENETPPNLDQLANMRRQCEQESRKQTLYRKRSKDWIEWEGTNECLFAMPRSLNVPRSQMFSGLAAMSWRRIIRRPWQCGLRS